MKSAIPTENYIDLLPDAVCVVGRDGYLRYVSADSAMYRAKRGKH